MKNEHKVVVFGHSKAALETVVELRKHGIKSLAVFPVLDKYCPYVVLADDRFCVGPLEGKHFIASIFMAASLKKADAIYAGNSDLANDSEFVQICKAYNLVLLGSNSEQADPISGFYLILT